MQTNKRIRFLLHPVTIFWFAVLLIGVSGRYKPLWEESNDPMGFLMGTIGGIACYYGTVALVRLKFPGVTTYSREVWKSLKYTRPGVRKIIILGGRAIYEEAFWRGTIQVLLGNGTPALFITALLFTGRHIYLNYGRKPLQTFIILEFFLFSLLLGSLYLISNRIMLVIAIHFIRNFLIAAKCMIAEVTHDT